MQWHKRCWNLSTVLEVNKAAFIFLQMKENHSTKETSFGNFFSDASTYYTEANLIFKIKYENDSFGEFRN
jgi:hypothetical protein